MDARVDIFFDRRGNPDFTNAPGHGDDDARFYERLESSDPKTRFDYSYYSYNNPRVYTLACSQRVALLTRPRFLDSARA